MKLLHSATLVVALAAPLRASVLGTDVRLDTDAVGMNSSCQPQISGGQDARLHVVWQDYRGRTWRIFHRGSPDWGASWPAPDTAIGRWGNAEKPRVAADGVGHVYVVWQAFGDGEERICFNRSFNNGSAWLVDERTLNTDREFAEDPRICCDGAGHVYVTWIEKVGGTDQALVNVSSDFGATWLPAPMRINTNPLGGSISRSARIACTTSGSVYVAYVDYRLGSSSAYFRRSQDFGVTWDLVETLLDASPSATWVDIVADDTGAVHVGLGLNNSQLRSTSSSDFGSTWLPAPVALNGAGSPLAGLLDLALAPDGTLFATYADNRSGTLDVYANASHDGGASWAFEQLVAPQPAGALTLTWPTVAADAGQAYVAWMDANGGYYDIQLASSPDGGATWINEGQVNSNPAGESRSAYPAMTARNDVLAIVWDDRRAAEGAPDTYFNTLQSAAGAAAPPRKQDGEPHLASARPLVPVVIAMLLLASVCVMRFVRHRLLIVCVVAVLLSAVSAGAETIENDRVRFDLSHVGTHLSLDSALNKQLGSPITFQTQSGKWDVLLREKNNYGNVHTLSMDGSGTDSLVLQTVAVGGAMLIADWVGSATFVGAPFDFAVHTEWKLAADSPSADTTIRFTVTSDNDVQFYVSELQYPWLYVPQMDATDQLLAPIISGYLHENPISTGPLPHFLNNDLPLISVPVLAYYGESSGRCLYFGDNDAVGWWKTPNVADNPAMSRLEFRMRHFPDDVFNCTDFRTPYGVRVGTLNGDWVDVARDYRQHLDTQCRWYKGPVGSGTNPMPSQMKQLVAQCQYGTAYPGDGLDIMARDTMRLARVFGEGVYTRWYGAYWPDGFDAFYDDGYLPGRPTFPAAMREAEKQFGHIAAPYIQGSIAYDYTIDPNFVPPANANNLGVYDSTLVKEDGSRTTGLFGFNAWMCNRAPWWENEFPRNITEIAEFTHMHGAYLDYYGTSSCYSDQHNHLPGGGTYPVEGRMDQLRDLKTRLAALPDPPEFFGLSMESVHSRFAEEVHMMYINPIFTTADGTPRTTVPFFRYAQDSVKISKIMGTSANGSTTGHSCWLAANEALTFGQIPGIGATVQEGTPSFANRAIEPYFGLLKKIAAFLRDRDFFRWHNWTMERIPPFTVTNAAGFPGQPGAGVGPYPLYMEEVLTPGMFLGGDCSLAFVLANPWVADDQQDFDVNATFDPAAYDGFPQGYSVRKVDDDGVSSDLGVHVGPFVINDTVATGEIVYWVFDRVDGDINGDGAADMADVAPFVEGLLDPDGIAATPLRCKTAIYDINRDGHIDGLDIQGFSTLLIGG